MPNHTKETIRATPILELYRANNRFRKALHTLVREVANGHLKPDEIESYVSNSMEDIIAAESWLQQSLSKSKPGFASYLENFKPEEIFNRLLTKDDDLQNRVEADGCGLGGFPHEQPVQEVQNNFNILLDYLNRHTGMDLPFCDFFLTGIPISFDNLGLVLAGWLMCVEYVHNLKRPPHLAELQPLTKLTKPLLKNCQHLIEQLRQQHSTYIELTQQVEFWINEELEAMQPEDLGKIDTFKQEETKVLESAVQALIAGNWIKALNWAESRSKTDSFWLKHDRSRRIVWSLVKVAATLGQTIEQDVNPLQNVNSLREAMDYYTTTGYQIDKVHRYFEQQNFQLLETTLPYYAQLVTVKNILRQKYRTWADTLAENFANICVKSGFLPEADLQQRRIYDRLIHPLTQSERRTAYFIIDAFRYEMATELIEKFKETGTTVNLQGCYSELPSITAVGMNVLAPVQQSGKLTLAGNKGFMGFKTGEYTVSKPSDRVQAMGDKSIDNISAGRRKARSLTLSDVCHKSTTSLKQSCANAHLIVVHSKEIDGAHKPPNSIRRGQAKRGASRGTTPYDAGEANVDIATFEIWLQQIKSAWHHLKSIGIQEFVFTADRGFLLQDETTQEITYGTKREPQRRYVLSDEPRQENDTVTVSLNALDYEGQQGYLLFPKTTAVFATVNNQNATFVHGGNSLQERVIPVLTVSHQQAASTPKILKYVIEAQVEPELFGFSRIKLKLKPESISLEGLAFVGMEKVNLALRVHDRADILITIKEAVGVELNNQELYLQADETWVEILFDLRGNQDERVRIEIFHPDNVAEIEPLTLTSYFNVSGALIKDKSSSEPALKSNNSDWQDSFSDANIKQVFLHLDRHNSLTETELNQMLGSPRQARRFAGNLEQYLTQVPFSVKVETTSNGKRYVKY
ncbi:alkaline phosphatase domain-containing protein [Stanieria sp. NIES-3757]|nr:alkaline phosphatase domain-containing protein [Stanieria sp. NIES-3757]